MRGGDAETIEEKNTGVKIFRKVASSPGACADEYREYRNRDLQFVWKWESILAAAAALGRFRPVANNFVSLDDGGHADLGRSVFRLPVDANYFSHCSNENFRTSSDFRRKREGEIQFGAGAKILINCKVNTASGDVARFPAVCGRFLFHWKTNDDRQGKVISTCCSTLGHLPLNPRVSCPVLRAPYFVRWSRTETGATELPNRQSLPIHHKIVLRVLALKPPLR